jgi:protein-tyrosine kinase
MLIQSGSKHLLDRHLVSFLDRSSFESDQYRRLRHRIEELHVGRDVAVLAVTSAVAGEGKTLTAINLAGALARGRATKVLLIDADLRRPSIARQLGIEYANGGFEKALESPHQPLEDFVQFIDGLGLAVLPCMAICEHAYDLVTSPRFTELVGEARLRYDYVIVDTPPVIPVPDCGLIRGLVDGYLVVVSANSTPRKLVGEALNMLGQGSVVGLVLNRDQSPMFGYYGTYYQTNSL